MKKSALAVLLAGIVVAACKKSYTCDCTVTQTSIDSAGTTYVSTYRNTVSSYTKKMSKSQAEEACRHEQGAVQSNFNVLITRNGTVATPTNLSISTACYIQQ